MWTTGGVAAIASALTVRPADVTPEAHLNSYMSDLPQGVYDYGTMVSVVGANGRRILIRDDVDGVYVGGALITDGAVLSALARLLDGMARR